MSLLMDALRKAEAAKQKTEKPQKSEQSGTATPAVQPPGSATKHTPDTETDSAADQELADVREFLKHREDQRTGKKVRHNEALKESTNEQTHNSADIAPPVARKQQPAFKSQGTESTNDQTRKDPRQTAAAVFSAKKPGRSNRQKNKVFIALLLGVPVLGATVWFWNSYTRANQSFVANVEAPVDRGYLSDAPTQPTELLPPAGTEVRNPLLDALAEETPAQLTETITLTAETANSINPDTDNIEPVQPAAVSRTVSESRQTNTETTSANQASQTASTFQLVTTAPADRLNKTLEQAYQHFQLGNYQQAKQLYQNYLNEAPNNTDALLGLAAISRIEGDTLQAQSLYARLLELNPRDPLARAGLIEATLSAASPIAAEEELNKLIRENPDSPPLHFALGNLQAQQNRWNDAENAYFEALALARALNPDSFSPDYAFNLAVSLERLNQLPLAYEYYQQAEAAARVTAAGFEPAILTRRLQFLEQQLR